MRVKAKMDIDGSLHLAATGEQPQFPFHILAQLQARLRLSIEYMSNPFYRYEVQFLK